VNDLQGHRNCCYLIDSKSVPVACSNKQHLSSTVSEIVGYYFQVWDCLWPWEVLKFQQCGWIYKSHAPFDSCANISQSIHAVFPELQEFRRF